MLSLKDIIAELKTKRNVLDDKRKVIEEQLKEMRILNAEADKLMNKSVSLGFAIERLEKLSSGEPEDEPEMIMESAKTWGDIENEY